MTDKPQAWNEVGKKLKEGAAVDNAPAVMEAVRDLVLPEEVMSFFKDNASVGTDNLGGDGAFFPYLKVNEANSNNVLADGKRSQPGNFYYAPTKEQFPEVLVNIVNISRGFYLKQEPKEETNDPKKLRKFVQLVGGVMVANQQPFVLIGSGTRLNNIWSFGKEIKAWTKSKTPIPMFAMKVRLSLEEVKTDYGFNHVVNFNLIKNESGVPEFVQDRGQLEFLKDVASKMKDQFTEYEHRFSVDPDTLQPIYDSPVEVDPEPAVEVVTPENINVEKMPF